MAARQKPSKPFIRQKIRCSKALYYRNKNVLGNKLIGGSFISKKYFMASLL